jgi:hypothetical protein
VTGVEKRAVEEATLSAGARQAYLIEEPMAAAIGAGLPVAEPTGNMIVDIGGGTTEVAVISLGGIVVSQSLRVGGDEMDEAIVAHIKKRVQAARRPADGRGDQARGRLRVPHARGGAGGGARPRHAHRPAEDRDPHVEEIRHALDEPVTQIIDAIKSTLDKTPPSWPRTSWTAASCSPAAARCCTGSTSGSATRRRCRAPRREPAHVRGRRLGPQSSRSSRRSTAASAPRPRAAERQQALLTDTVLETDRWCCAGCGRRTARRCGAGTPTRAT